MLCIVERVDHPELQLLVRRDGCAREGAVRRSRCSCSVNVQTHCSCPRFTYGKPYYMLAFAIFVGLAFPVPFWLVHRYSRPGSRIAKTAAYINTPIIALYVGYLPYSVNGQWWCVFGNFSPLHAWHLESSPSCVYVYAQVVCRDRLRGTMVGAQVSPGVVQEVQLPDVGGAGWRESSHHVHPRALLVPPLEQQY